MTLSTIKLKLLYKFVVNYVVMSRAINVAGCWPNQSVTKNWQLIFLTFHLQMVGRLFLPNRSHKNLENFIPPYTIYRYNSFHKLDSRNILPHLKCPKYDLREELKAPITLVKPSRVEPLGPDGFILQYYKQFLPTLGPYMVKLFNALGSETEFPRENLESSCLHHS